MKLNLKKGQPCLFSNRINWHKHLFEKEILEIILDKWSSWYGDGWPKWQCQRLKDWGDAKKQQYS